jgi:hypothetical protein
MNLLGGYEARRGGLNLPKGGEFMYRAYVLAWLRDAFARMRTGATQEYGVREIH